MRAHYVAVALMVGLLAGCQDQQTTATPKAIAMTEEALGHYCQMNLTEHEGPKAQIHLARFEHPIWFSQVRDAIAFTRLPEETEEVSVVYVSDMGHAESWSDPGIENWVDAAKAWFVIGSDLRGGMGAPEAVPFGDQAAAEHFARKNGGDIVRLADIPDDYVLGPVDIEASTADRVLSDDTGAGDRDGQATQ